MLFVCVCMRVWELRARWPLTLSRLICCVLSQVCRHAWHATAALVSTSHFLSTSTNSMVACRIRYSHPHSHFLHNAYLIFTAQYLPKLMNIPVSLFLVCKRVSVRWLFLWVLLSSTLHKHHIIYVCEYCIILHALIELMSLDFLYPQLTEKTSRSHILLLLCHFRVCLSFIFS